MIYLKSKDKIDLMAISGKVCGQILHDLANVIKPGISTQDIDDFVREAIVAEGMTPTFLGYNGFPASSCVSVNDEIVHGIPSASRILKEGEIVSVDIGATFEGYVSDAARTYPVGTISGTAAHLIEVCRDSFFCGLDMCRDGGRLTDIGSAIQTKVESEGFSVVRDYVGHGIGRQMHEDPQIRNYGEPGKGAKLISGMTLAIEPMINEGGYDTTLLDNKWTAVTADGKLSAHYENTVVITDSDPLVLTLDKRDRI